MFVLFFIENLTTFLPLIDRFLVSEYLLEKMDLGNLK